MKFRSVSRSVWGRLLAVGVLLALSACNINVSATVTPAFIEGSTVFSAVRWREPSSAIDVVFIPDDDYGNMNTQSNRQTFLDDISNLIDSGFWQNNALASNITSVNFWFTTLTGNAGPPTGDAICPTVTWPNLPDAAFAEVLILIHQNDLRDCRWGNRVTAEPTSFRTVVHEFSHAAFNLPDEYCCDGGYRHLPPVLYNSQNSCTSDAANAGWRNCISFTGSGNRGTWWRSEDSTIDIMSGTGNVVLEAGQGDWAVMRNVFNALGAGTPQTPDVFAPNTWDWN